MQLAPVLARAVSSGRATAFGEILGLQQQAALAVAKQVGVPNGALGAILAPNVSMAGVWESLGKGAATWRTVLGSHVLSAADDAQRVVTAALLGGTGPDELARRLRPYLQGSEPFREAFKGAGDWTNAMLRDAGFAEDARKLRYNADRIAYSEIHNARSEAEVQAFAADPFVAAVRWTLSPNRGTLRGPDACDGLAESDLYGMGAGVYPVTDVPIAPHPWCSCERLPIARDPSQVGLPKPTGTFNPNALIKGTGCG